MESNLFMILTQSTQREKERGTMEVCCPTEHQKGNLSAFSMGDSGRQRIQEAVNFVLKINLEDSGEH